MGDNLQDHKPAWRNIETAEAEFLRNLADNGGLPGDVPVMLRQCAKLLTARPVGGQLEEQAEAWRAVFRTLSQVAPGWMFNDENGPRRGYQLACDAIRKLAAAPQQAPAAPSPDGLPDDAELDRCERIMTACTCIDDYKMRGRSDPQCQACDMGVEIIDTFRTLRAAALCQQPMQCQSTAFEGWFGAIEDAGEVASNATDPRIVSRAKRIVKWLESSKPVQAAPVTGKLVGWWNGIMPDVMQRSVQEPSVRWGADAEDSGHDIPLYDGYNPIHYATPNKAVQAAPGAVAWRYRDVGDMGWRASVDDPRRGLHNWDYIEPLYTAPNTALTMELSQ